MKTPNFWNSKNFVSNLLLPLSFIYGFLRFLDVFFFKVYKSNNLKIICIENIKDRRNGKKTVAIEIGKILRENNIHFAYLSKGYKGRIKNFTKVDLTKHSPIDVGDEPLILAKYNDTFICKNRKEALMKLSENYDYKYIIMDDGFQNPTIFKDKSIVVVDGKNGIGNGRLLPSGALRETISSAIKRASFFIIVNKDETNFFEKIDNKKEIINASIQEENKNFGKDRYIAFCGLGKPQKFFDSLKKANYNVIKEIVFEDHYYYKDKDLKQILDIAEKNNAKVITTEKDFVKLPNNYKGKVEILKINVMFENKDRLKELLLND